MPELRNADLLDALADAIATIATIARPSGVPSAESKCGIWSHRANDDVSTDPYSVLVTWGGADASQTVPELMVQVVTRGSVAGVTMRRAEVVHNALLEPAEEGDTLGEQRRPRRDWQIGNAETTGLWLVMAIRRLEPPRSIGFDDRGRAEVVFDFAVSAVRRTA